MAHNLKRTLIGVLIGVFAAIGGNVHTDHSFPQSAFIPAHSAHASGCSTVQGSQPGIGQVVSPSHSLFGTQTNISFSSTDLGPGYVNCVDNAYWVGMQGSETSGCGGVGEFAQVGWVAQYNPGNGTVTYPNFYEYYNSANYTGCGTSPVYTNTGNAASQTYKVVVTYNSCNGDRPAVLIYMYAGSSLIGDVCADWSEGATTLVVATELQGSTNHAGKVGFWWTKYCLSSDCTPGTEPSSASPSSGNSEVYIGKYNVQQLSWPNWNTCDINDFTSSTC